MRLFDESARKVAALADEERLSVPCVLDTLAHADHFSAMARFRRHTGARGVIGWRITGVQETFARPSDLDVPTDGRGWDVLVGEGEVLDAGPRQVRAHGAPGHTPACSTQEIGEMPFVGNVVFMPDFGTARRDFPTESASQLDDSIPWLYAFHDCFETCTGHDHQPGGRVLRVRATVGEQQASNVRRCADTRREDFVAFREARDATLSLPCLMLPCHQVNAPAGREGDPTLPGADAADLIECGVPVLSATRRAAGARLTEVLEYLVATEANAHDRFQRAARSLGGAVGEAFHSLAKAEKAHQDELLAMFLARPPRLGARRLGQPAPPWHPAPIGLGARALRATGSQAGRRARGRWNHREGRPPPRRGRRPVRLTSPARTRSTPRSAPDSPVCPS